jgi:uncharacterized membrane protein
MSDLTVVGFTGEDTVDSVLHTLATLSKEPLIDLKDACVVGGHHHGNRH